MSYQSIYTGQQIDQRLTWSQDLILVTDHLPINQSSEDQRVKLTYPPAGGAVFDLILVHSEQGSYEMLVQFEADAHGSWAVFQTPLGGTLCTVSYITKKTAEPQIEPALNELPTYV